MLCIRDSVSAREEQQQHQPRVRSVDEEEEGTRGKSNELLNVHLTVLLLGSFVAVPRPENEPRCTRRRVQNNLYSFAPAARQIKHRPS